MTAITEVKQPNFLMVKWFWIAIDMPVTTLFFSDSKGLTESVLVWGFVCAMLLLMFAYKIFRIKKWNACTRDVLEEHDGMWSHEFSSTSMKLDEKRGVIHLKEENKQNNLSFLGRQKIAIHPHSFKRKSRYGKEKKLDQPNALSGLRFFHLSR